MTTYTKLNVLAQDGDYTVANIDMGQGKVTALLLNDNVLSTGDFDFYADGWWIAVSASSAASLYLNAADIIAAAVKLAA